MKTKTLFLVCLIVFLPTGFLVSLPSVHASTTLTLRPNANGTYSQFVEVPDSGFLFGDQFESNDFSLWTSTIHSGATIATTTTVAHSGIYSCVISGLTAVGRYGFAEKTITTSTNVCMRAYIEFTTDFSKLSTETALLRYNQGGGAEFYNANLERQADGTYRWHISSQVSGLDYASSSFPLSLNTWYCIELRGTMSTTVGVLHLDVNGVSQIDQTGLNLGSSGIGTVRVEAFNSPNNTNAGTIYWDDVVVSTSGPIGAEACYNLVNDQSDNTALQVTANTTQKETENLADTTQTGTINSVTVDMRVKASTTSLQVVTVTRTHSADYEGSATTISNSAFTDYTTVYTTNPNTGVAWVWAEVNALEVGARACTLASGTIQFSEFYVTVTCTSDATAPIYSSISTNTTLANNPCSFNCLVSDDTNVSTYIFSTNNTGIWTNDTATTFVDFFNTTAAWANVTKTLNDTVGNVVSYLWYANDTSNNWSSSDQYDLTLTAPIYRPSLQMTPDNVTCRIYLETFSVQINVTNAIDAQAFNFTIYYDPQVLNCSSVSWGELGTGTMMEIDTTNGILEGNVAGSPLNGNHWLLNITFQAINATIWKEGLANKLEGKIWFHQALLGFADGSTLQYVEGGVNQIDVNQAAYTFLPIQGDVDNNGVVDIFDLRTVATYFDAKEGDPNWTQASAYDLLISGQIDVGDILVVTSNFGFTYP